MRFGVTKMYAWCVGVVWYEVAQSIGVQVGRRFYYVTWSKF